MIIVYISLTFLVLISRTRVGKLIGDLIILWFNSRLRKWAFKRDLTKDDFEEIRKNTFIDINSRIVKRLTEESAIKVLGKALSIKTDKSDKFRR